MIIVFQSVAWYLWSRWVGKEKGNWKIILKNVAANNYENVIIWEKIYL